MRHKNHGTEIRVGSNFNYSLRLFRDITESTKAELRERRQHVKPSDRRRAKLRRSAKRRKKLELRIRRNEKRIARLRKHASNMELERLRKKRKDEQINKSL